MRFYTLLFIPLVISQPCGPSIRPLETQNSPSLSIPCPLIPYVKHPSLRSYFLRSKKVENIVKEDEDDEYIEDDIEYVEID